jgi:hypothetical protein
LVFGGTDHPHDIVIEPELIVRESSGPAPLGEVARKQSIVMLRRTFLAMPAELMAQTGLPGFYKRVHRLSWVTPDAAATSAAWAKLGAQVLRTFPPANLEGARVQGTVGLLGRLIVD